MTRNSFRRMENKLTPIDLLIANNLSDSATPAESAELKAWIGESPRNKKLFEDHQRIWENSHPYLAVSDIISDREQIKDQIIQELTKTSKTRKSVSYTHLRAHETRHDLVCRLLLEKKKKTTQQQT